jgi:hypothetical protein
MNPLKNGLEPIKNSPTSPNNPIEIINTTKEIIDRIAT